MSAARKAKLKNEGFGLLAASGGRALGFRLLMVWLTVAFAFAALFMGRLAWDPSVGLSQLLPFVVFSAACVAEWALLRRSTLNADARIFEIATFLVGIGMAMQFRMGTFSGGGAIGFRLALPAGLAAMLLVYLLASNGRWEKMSAAGYVCYVLAVALLGAMVVLGRRYRGGVYLPGNVNPSEFVKPLLVVFLASFLAGRKKAFSAAVAGVPTPHAGSLLTLAVLWCVPLALVMALHDLGLILLLNAVLVVMLYAVGRRVGYLALGAVGVVGAGSLLWMVSSHVKARFCAWLDPFSDPTGTGWQILQGLSALYAGGIWGAGIGAGSPQAVPIVTSDFVYAAIAEELGIVISALILALYACLFCRGFIVAGRTRSPFGNLLATGLAASLAVQALLNVAGVTKALPLTGIVLPFLSQGGSGLMAMLAMTGLLAAVSSGKEA